jgi:hypothetical protein
VIHLQSTLLARVLKHSTRDAAKDEQHGENSSHMFIKHSNKGLREREGACLFLKGQLCVQLCGIVVGSTRAHLITARDKMMTATKSPITNHTPRKRHSFSPRDFFPRNMIKRGDERSDMNRQARRPRGQAVRCLPISRKINQPKKILFDVYIYTYELHMKEALRSSLIRSSQVYQSAHLLGLAQDQCMGQQFASPVALVDRTKE